MGLNTITTMSVYGCDHPFGTAIKGDGSEIQEKMPESAPGQDVAVVRTAAYERTHDKDGRDIIIAKLPIPRIDCLRASEPEYDDERIGWRREIEYGTSAQTIDIVLPAAEEPDPWHPAKTSGGAPVAYAEKDGKEYAEIDLMATANKAYDDTPRDGKADHVKRSTVRFTKRDSLDGMSARNICRSFTGTLAQIALTNLPRTNSGHDIQRDRGNSDMIYGDAGLARGYGRDTADIISASFMAFYEDFMRNAIENGNPSSDPSLDYPPLKDWGITMRETGRPGSVREAERASSLRMDLECMPVTSAELKGSLDEDTLGMITNDELDLMAHEGLDCMAAHDRLAQKYGQRAADIRFELSMRECNDDLVRAVNAHFNKEWDKSNAFRFNGDRACRTMAGMMRLDLKIDWERIQESRRVAIDPGIRYEMSAPADALGIAVHAAQGDYDIVAADGRTAKGASVTEAYGIGYMGEAAELAIQGRLFEDLSHTLESEREILRETKAEMAAEAKAASDALAALRAKNAEIEDNDSEGPGRDIAD